MRYSHPRPPSQPSRASQSIQCSYTRQYNYLGQSIPPVPDKHNGRSSQDSVSRKSSLSRNPSHSIEPTHHNLSIIRVRAA